MATFVEITPDPFANTFAKQLSGQVLGRTTGGTGYAPITNEYDHVRRPVRGIQIKRDTYATIEVKTSKGQNIPLVNSGGYDYANNVGAPYSGRNSNFLLSSIQESREEKQQVVLTFGEPFIFFYGEQPRMLQVAGALMNSEDFNWRAEWWENYDKYLRGTKAVEQKARVYLTWDDILVEGYLMNCSAQETSENRNIVMFNFTMFLTNYANFSNIASAQFPGASIAEIQLNPNDLDTTGEGIGTLKSSTLEVRSLNIKNDMFSKASLMDFVREGIQTAVTIYDSVMDVYQMASQFLGGRLVRVPTGYGGSAVFDDVQLSLASVDVAAGGVVALSGQLGNRAFLIQGTVADKWEGTPKNRRGAIALNTDEYLVKSLPPKTGPLNPQDLFAGQAAEKDKLPRKVQETFLQFGLTTEPPSDLLILAGRATFALMNLAAPAGGFGSEADQASLVFSVLQ